MSGGHLYRVYDQDGLIYIGSTIRLWMRMYEHRRHSWWATSVVKVRAELVGDEKLMRKLETKAIFSEMPRWNVYEQSRLIPSMTPEEFVEYMDRWRVYHGEQFDVSLLKQVV